MTGDNQCISTDVVTITAYARPSIVTGSIDVYDCSSDLTTYEIGFVSNVFVDNDDVSAGTLLFENGAYRIVDIPAGTPVEITLTNGECTVVETIASPVCACPATVPQPQVAVTERYYCAGETPPTLSVANLPGYRANWYDAVTGALLQPNATSFTPNGPGRYAVEYVDQNFSVCSSLPTEIRVVALAELVSAPIPEIVLCAGEPLAVSPELTQVTAGVALEYEWDGQPGNASYSVIPAQAGPQTLTWSVAYTGNRCRQERTVDYYVIPEPTIIPINQEPCGEDTTVYRVAFYSEADSVRVQSSSGTVNRIGDEYFVEDVAIGTSVQVFAANTYQGVSCGPVTYTFDSPANCLCASNTLSYAYSSQTYAYCPEEALPALSFPDPGEGFELVFFTAAGDPVVGIDATSMVPPSPGAYYFQIRDQAQNCFSFLTYPFEVAVRPSPVAVAGMDRFTCEGYSVELDGTNSEYQGPGEWLWSAPIPLQNVTSPIPQAQPITSGIYPIILRLTDTHGCVDRDTLLLEVAETPTANYLLLDTIACFGDATGRVFIEPSGGMSPYTYEWVDGETARLRGGLAAGAYDLTLTDAMGCAAAATITIEEPPELIAAAALTDIVCNGAATGAVEITASGGTPPYTYVWSTGATTADLSGVPAGSYAHTVTDGGGCTAETEYILTEPPALAITTVDTMSATDGLPNGSIAVTVTGGTRPYSYAWFAGDTPLATQDSLVQDLEARDDYRVEITDANGCTLISGPIAVTLSTATYDLSATALGLRVFPNPTQGRLTLAVNRVGALAVWITHPDGRVVQQVRRHTDSQGRLALEIDKLPAGVYFLRVRLDADYSVVPIVKW